MVEVVVIGGGVAGCAAALTARKAGAEVTLAERLNILGGALKRAGRLKNGDFVAAEEARALGGGDFFDMFERIALHRKGIAGENPALVYDCGRVDSAIQRILESYNVRILLERRVVDVEKEHNRITAVKMNDGEQLTGDSFIDATGTAGGFDVCVKYGHGCILCPYKCPSFGDRVSIATKAGAPERTLMRPNGSPGSVGASVRIFKDTLSKELQNRLEKEGAVLIPLNPEIVEFNLRKLRNEIAAPRTEEQMKTANLVNIGPIAKLVGTGYYPLPLLRSIPGFEEVETEGNSAYGFIGSTSIIMRDDTMKVEDFENLYVAGDHSGFFGGITDCLCTGLVAGHNAARTAQGMNPSVLPRSTVIGDSIVYQGEFAKREKGFKKAGSMGQGAYLDRMLQTGLFTLNPSVIRKRVENAGLLDLFTRKLA